MCVLCVCVCFLLFLLYNPSLRKASVSLFVYMCRRTLPTGLTRRPERRLSGDGAVKRVDRQEESKRGRRKQNGEAQGSDKRYENPVANVRGQMEEEEEEYCLIKPFYAGLRQLLHIFARAQ